MLVISKNKDKNMPDKVRSTYSFQTSEKILNVDEEKLIHGSKDINNTTLFSRVRISSRAGCDARTKSLEDKSGRVYYHRCDITYLLINDLIKKA
jgi:hypothetical protein